MYIYIGCEYTYFLVSLQNWFKWKLPEAFNWCFLPCEVTLGGKLLVAYRDSEEEGAGGNGTESQRTPFSKLRKLLLDTQVFVGVRETWVLLVPISWNSLCFRSLVDSKNPMAWFDDPFWTKEKIAAVLQAIWSLASWTNPIWLASRRENHRGEKGRIMKIKGREIRKQPAWQPSEPSDPWIRFKFHCAPWEVEMSSPYLLAKELRQTLTNISYTHTVYRWFEMIWIDFRKSDVH